MCCMIGPANVAGLSTCQSVATGKRMICRGTDCMICPHVKRMICPANVAGLSTCQTHDLSRD